MRAEDILRRCADRNIQVEGKNGRLLVNPASALTPDLRMELKRGSRIASQTGSKARTPLLSCACRRLPLVMRKKAPLSPYQLGLYNLHLDERDNTNVLNQTGVLDLLFVPTEQEVMASFEKLLEITGRCACPSGFLLTANRSSFWTRDALYVLRSTRLRRRISTTRLLKFWKHIKEPPSPWLLTP